MAHRSGRETRLHRGPRLPSPPFECRIGHFGGLRLSSCDALPRWLVRIFGHNAFGARGINFERTGSYDFQIVVGEDVVYSTEFELEKGPVSARFPGGAEDKE